MLQRYSEFSPTPVDSTGLNLPDRQDWFIAPIGLTRDSGDLDTSNWEVSLLEIEEIDPDGGDWEIHRFGHWACGWLEVLIVRPDTACNDWMIKTSESLENYPILNEMDYSDREWNSTVEAWGYTTMSDRIDILSKHGLSVFAARRDEVPQDLPHFEDFFEAS